MSPKMHAVALQSLHFDPENPRLPSRLSNAAEPEVLEYLLLECNLIELMLSIAGVRFLLFLVGPVLETSG